MQPQLVLTIMDNFATEAFNQAVRKGTWRAIVSWFTRQCNCLLPLDRDKLRRIMRGQRYLGLQTVPLDQIVGSEGRHQEFDRAFFPRQTHTMERWLSLAKAHYQSVTLPPINLIKVDNNYFVTDGNHRISVARALEQQFIEAEVVEVLTAVPFPSPC
ncbi:MAG: hypothetical protein CL608_12855 [Anaerolineaceae bacterium]|nr:hypothetical protein [Anaerolineaceae bacterium]